MSSDAKESAYLLLDVCLAPAKTSIPCLGIELATDSEKYLGGGKFYECRGYIFCLGLSGLGHAHDARSRFILWGHGAGEECLGDHHAKLHYHCPYKP